MFSKRCTQVAKPTRVRRGVAVFVGALVVGVVAASPAAATFGAPFDLSADEHGGGSQVAIDADGDAVFTWVRHDGSDYRVQARARSASGVLSAVQNLSAARGEAGMDPRSRSTRTATRCLPGGRPSGRIPGPGAGALRRRRPERGADPLEGRSGCVRPAGRGGLGRRRRVRLAARRRDEPPGPGPGTLGSRRGPERGADPLEGRSGCVRPPGRGRLGRRRGVHLAALRRDATSGSRRGRARPRGP